MQRNLHIQYLQRGQINDDRWNACINSADNGLIYAYTHYLDCMCDNWDALVMNDYEAVMPLPWRKKGGIHYIYHPYLTAQLGVFGKTPDGVLLEAFLKAIPRKFRYLDFPLNQQNLFPVPGFPLYQRSNYVLSLQRPYEELSKAYRENIRRNIKKSNGYGCTVVKGFDADAIITLAKQQGTAVVSEKDFGNFRRLYAFLKQKGLAETYGVLSGKKDLFASCVFFFSHKRAYYILVGNHPNGRTLGASHALIDAFIKDHAGQDLLLDFEGSDLRNLAFFYSSFGAKEEKYAAIKMNRLPWWLKWVKSGV
ncbi:MAG TPA: GNAT family N-acetyltransferase [Flavisolibacter sp.]|nr:GNAT family N-acetyltransferase [Flavisolibacter sp.]